MPKGDGLKFLSAFLRDPNRIGAIAPSSSRLARAMLRGLVLEDGDGLIEFGPGTGSFTRAILEILPSPRSYLGIETQEPFVELLRERYPDLTFRLGSAENAADYAREHGLSRVRAIISGLPFASLPQEMQDGIVVSLEGLMAAGTEFRTFQYLHAYLLPKARRFRKRMAAAFGPHRRYGPVLWNLPPAFALAWKRVG